MATQLLKQFKQKIKGLELEPSGGGCFELTVNGDLLYSKLEQGRFPDEQQMVELVGQKLAAK